MNSAVKLHRTSHRLYCFWGTRWLGKIVYWLNRLINSCDIDPRCEIPATVLIPHGTGVVIGETAAVGERTVIMPGVVIGARDWGKQQRHAIIGSDVLIGAGAKVIGAVSVGDGARVGANAVVLTDVPAGSTAVGVPAVVSDGGDAG